MNCLKKQAMILTSPQTFDQSSKPKIADRTQDPEDDAAIRDFLDQIDWMKVGTDIADYLLPLPDDSDLLR